jgi:hypothetical protein
VHPEPKPPEDLCTTPKPPELHPDLMLSQSILAHGVPAEFAGKTIGVSINMSAVRDVNAADSSFWCKFWLNILYEDADVRTFF